MTTPGRRHQLRYHCSKGLGAPIVGDAAYGFKGLPPTAYGQLSGAGLGESWWASYGEQSSPGANAAAAGGTKRGGQSARGAAPGGGTLSGGTAMAAVTPVMLHSRQVVVRRPRLEPLKVVAPVPRYMADAMEALGWDVS